MFFLLPGTLFGQKRFINHLDSSFARNSYFEIETAGACNGAAELDPYNIDYDLLNCLLIREVNNYRKKKHLPLMKYDDKLDKLAQNYLNYFNRSTFVNQSKNKIKVNRPLRKAAKKLNYRNGIIAAAIYQAALVIPTKKMGVFYYENQGNDPLNLFYGLLPTKQELKAGIKLDPVKPCTYDAFVKNLFTTKILRSYRNTINDKAMRLIGCRSLVIPQSLHKHQFPAANFMLIIGAPRLQLLPDSTK